MSNALYPTNLPGLTWDSVKTPNFNTIVHEAVDGSELRGSYMATPKWTISLAYDLLRDSVSFVELKTLAGFFLARQGSFDSFLYLDADDNTAQGQSFGLGDGSTLAFQLARYYGNAAEQCCNIGSSPAPTIYVNGVAKTLTTDYTIDSSGLVTFVAAPTAGFALTWDGVYYYRCRFKADMIDFNQFMAQLWEAKTVELVGTLGSKL